MHSKIVISALMICACVLALMGYGCTGVDAEESTSYSVAYEVGDMTHVVQVGEGGVYTLLPAAELGDIPEGMTFTGWLTADGTTLAAGSSITVKADVRLVAQFEQTVFKAEFISEKKSLGEFEGVLDTPVEMPETPVREGWIFRGWSDGEKTHAEGVPDLTRSVKYEAVWSQDYNITYKIDDLVVLVTCVSKSEVPQDPSRIGFRFEGWTMDGELVDPRTVVLEKDSEFLAEWTAAVYTVNFTVDGEVKATQTVLHGDRAMAPLVSQYPGGYDGWNWDFNTPITADTTIEAKKAEVDNATAYFAIGVSAILALVAVLGYRWLKNGTIAINRKKGGA